jgi:hypothetical protein
MREIIRTAIIAATTLPAEQVLSGQAPDTPSTDEFIALRWGNVTQRIGPVQRRELVVWCYDRGSDYRSWIDTQLGLIRTALTALVHVSDPFGRVNQVEWFGESQDGFDQGYQRVYRFANYAVVGSEE